MSLFSDLYPSVRTLLGDVNAQPVYTNTQLDLGIGLALLLDETEFSEGALSGGGDRTITPDVTERVDKARLSIKAAICLISPQSGAFSYRTKVLSVTRENAKSAHLGWLEAQLRKLTNEGYVIASETEWDQFLRGSADALSKLNSFPS